MSSSVADVAISKLIPDNISILQSIPDVLYPWQSEYQRQYTWKTAMLSALHSDKHLGSNQHVAYETASSTSQPLKTLNTDLRVKLDMPSSAPVVQTEPSPVTHTVKFVNETCSTKSVPESAHQVLSQQCDTPANTTSEATSSVVSQDLTRHVQSDQCSTGDKALASTGQAKDDKKPYLIVDRPTLSRMDHTEDKHHKTKSTIQTNMLKPSNLATDSRDNLKHSSTSLQLQKGSKSNAESILMPFGYGNTNPVVQNNMYKTFNVRAPSQQVYPNTFERGDRIKTFENTIISPVDAETSRPRIPNPTEALQQYLKAKSQVAKLQAMYHSEYRSKFLDWTHPLEESLVTSNDRSDTLASPLSPVLKACIDSPTDKRNKSLLDTAKTGISTPYRGYAAGLPSTPDTCAAFTKRQRSIFFDASQNVPTPVATNRKAHRLPADQGHATRSFFVEADPRVKDLRLRKPADISGHCSVTQTTARQTHTGSLHSNNTNQTPLTSMSLSILPTQRRPTVKHGVSILDQIAGVKSAGISDAEALSYKERRHYTFGPDALQSQIDAEVALQK
ncbi:hypothetical protein QVD99_000235 [Batrachochytrium dendrobatidis]|nr:hypothetical protein O5D80_006473 [Batrachochytrium dendrobatidis]KAK5672733.1 hypothetical protein QVD99_000235 [Batrachochytrium dendrobatidis]